MFSFVPQSLLRIRTVRENQEGNAPNKNKTVVVDVNCVSVV